MKNSQSIKNILMSQKAKANASWSDELSARVNSLSDLLRSKMKTINGLILRNKGRGLITILLKFSRGVRPRSTKSVVKQVVTFSFFIHKLAKHNGLKGVVIYLKACQVLLQQVVGGYRVNDLGELKVRPARNKAGIPLIIPAGIRVLISRDRHIPSIKLWMTLLGLYRILEVKGSLSFATITDKGPDLTQFLMDWDNYINLSFIPLLFKQVGKIPKLDQPRIYPILKSGPNVLTEDDKTRVLIGNEMKLIAPKFYSEIKDVNTSMNTLIISSRLFLRTPLKEAFKVLSNELGAPGMINRLEISAMASNPILDNPNLWSKCVPYPKGEGFLGKLSFKIEAAGKIRVFAMVDAWTQWLLSPIHDFIFSLLRKLNQDGTFNQMSPIEQLQSKFGANPSKKVFASIDLSAATDRLPISLQQTIIKYLLKEKVNDSVKVAENWRHLLVARAYKVGYTKEILDHCLPLSKEEKPDYVHYGVGQPMGALSSWAMLALTHHSLIQYAYFKAYGRNEWFQNYAVLGDDGVIVGKKVIKEYLSLLQLIGVKTGLAKSIIAKNKFVIEFAKKFFVDTTTANMLPLKECIATSSSTSLVAEFVRKYDLSLNAILSFLGYGYKAKMRASNSSLFNLSTRLRVILVWLTNPINTHGKSTYLEWLSMYTIKDCFPLTPSHLEHIKSLCLLLFETKLSRMNKHYELYMDSLDSFDSYSDGYYPISLTSQGSENRANQVNIPWRAIVNPDLSDSEDYDSLMKGSSHGGSVFNRRIKEVWSIKLGADLSTIVRPTLTWDDPITLDSINQEFWGLEGISDFHLLSLKDKINFILKWYFGKDHLSSILPQEFWSQVKAKEKDFRDFLQIYKVWQNLSKPLWSSYYQSLNPAKVKVLRNNVLKVKPLKAYDPTLVLVGLNSTFKMINNLERGEPERLGKSSYVIWTSLIKIFDWSLSLMETVFISSIISFFGLTYYYESAVALPPLDVEDNSVVTLVTPEIMNNNNNIIMVMLFVAGIIFLAIGYYRGEFDSPPVITIDEVSSTTIIEDYLNPLVVEGPLTLQEWQNLQDSLAYEAWMANLAISPIGDLWVHPFA